MGAIRFGVDGALVELLSDLLSISVFVETGTYRGDTIEAVLPTISEIHSIEVSEDLFSSAVRRFRDRPSVHLHRGESPDVLGRLRPLLEARPALYWLDAHWCSDGKADGEPPDSGSPLLAELEALGRLNQSSAVMIDDARLYLSPPPAPHAGDRWPTFSQVLDAVAGLGDAHEPVVVDDVIVVYPSRISAQVTSFAREHAVDVLAKLERLRALEAERVVLLEALDERLHLIETLDRELKGVSSGSDPAT